MFFQKKFSLYVGKMELLYFLKWNFLAPRLKKFWKELSKGHILEIYGSKY